MYGYNIPYSVDVGANMPCCSCEETCSVQGMSVLHKPCFVDLVPEMRPPRSKIRVPELSLRGWNDSGIIPSSYKPGMESEWNDVSDRIGIEW